MQWLGLKFTFEEDDREYTFDVPFAVDEGEIVFADSCDRDVTLMEIEDTTYGSATPIVHIFHYGGSILPPFDPSPVVEWFLSRFKLHQWEMNEESAHRDELIEACQKHIEERGVLFADIAERASA